MCVYVLSTLVMSGHVWSTTTRPAAFRVGIVNNGNCQTTRHAATHTCIVMTLAAPFGSVPWRSSPTGHHLPPIRRMSLEEFACSGARHAAGTSAQGIHRPRPCFTGSRSIAKGWAADPLPLALCTVRLPFVQEHASQGLPGALCFRRGSTDPPAHAPRNLFDHDMHLVDDPSARPVPGGVHTRVDPVEKKSAEHVRLLLHGLVQLNKRVDRCWRWKGSRLDFSACRTTESRQTQIFCIHCSWNFYYSRNLSPASTELRRDPIHLRVRL